MRADTYTNAVLTVIAACLVYLCVDRGSPAQAQVQGERVLIAGWVDAGGIVRQFPVAGSPVNRGVPVELLTTK